MFWYSHIYKNFPQFVVIHTIKGFGMVKRRSRCFIGALLFFDDPTDVSNLISDSSAFSNQLDHLELYGSCTVEAWLREF